MITSKDINNATQKRFFPDAPNKKDKCVSCNADTEYDEFEHIDCRYFYIEGVGQLCPECGNKLYEKNKKRDINN